MNDIRPIVSRVLSNNAVVVTTGAIQQVLVGRGIGFGIKVGQEIPDADPGRNETQHYVELAPEQAHFLNSLKAIDQRTVETISASIDLAARFLGELDPTIYVLLVEHISFAIDRLRRGEVITNAIAGEISAVFPDEYAAAELMVQYINDFLHDVALPAAEAGFVALHLNAARGGVSVKTPLAKANELAELVSVIRRSLHIDEVPSVSGEREFPDDGLVLTIARLIRRLREGNWRTMRAHELITQQLPVETDIANAVICRILDVTTMPVRACGEAAYLAVFLHGCVQEHHNAVERTTL